MGLQKESVEQKKQRTVIPDFVDEDNQPLQYDNKYSFLLQHFFPQLEDLNEFQQNISDRVATIKEEVQVNNDFPQISDQEVDFAVLSAKSNSAPGCDKISNKVLKKILPTISFHLTSLYNQIIRTGYHPLLWRQHKMVPIAKPGRQSNLLGSWRPISLLVCMSKILESIMNKRFQQFIFDNNLVSLDQFGFVPGRSIQMALQQYHDFVVENFHEQWAVAHLALDIKSAFDTLWHDGFFYKLHQDGCPPYMFVWFVTFLDSRQAFLLMENQRFFSNISQGVPQGSPISPTMFIYYLNDLLLQLREFTDPNRNIASSNVLAFADDVNYQFAFNFHELTLGSTFEEIEKTLKAWSLQWRLNFNPKKSELIFFSNLQKHAYYGRIDHDSFFFLGKWIFPVDSIKLLGVTFSRNLSWEDHVSKVVVKAKKKLHILRTFSDIKHGSIFNFMRHVVYQQIIPSLFFQACIWQSVKGKQYLLQKLKQVLRLAALAITQMNRGASNDILFAYALIYPPQIYILREVYRYFYHLKFKQQQPIESMQDQLFSTILKKTAIEISLQPEFKQGVDLGEDNVKTTIDDVCLKLHNNLLQNSEDLDAHFPQMLQLYANSKLLKLGIATIPRFYQKLLFQFLSGRYTTNFSNSFFDLNRHPCIFCYRHFGFNHFLECSSQFVRQKQQQFQIQRRLQNFKQNCNFDDVVGLIAFLSEVNKEIQRQQQFMDMIT
eukprot:TRINITY_DN21_c0_g1_i1.p1 TRINITY_DN21_c0_g1~~TRINITY_DN21_c0_g1_i1.p1  ORF type:complete len:716 (+),score=33.64 TRINITY_DN21_c0_g1_i1:241-2388(+)